MAREREELLVEEKRMIDQVKKILTSEDLSEDQKIEQIREIDRVKLMSRKETVMFEVCKTGSIKIFQSLYEQNLKEILEKEHYQKLLDKSLSSKNLEFVKYLFTIIPELINICKADGHYNSILHSAAYDGNKDIVVQNSAIEDDEVEGGAEESKGGDPEAEPKKDDTSELHHVNQLLRPMDDTMQIPPQAPADAVTESHSVSVGVAGAGAGSSSGSGSDEMQHSDQASDIKEHSKEYINQMIHGAYDLLRNAYISIAESKSKKEAIKFQNIFLKKFNEEIKKDGVEINNLESFKEYCSEDGDIYEKLSKFVSKDADYPKDADFIFTQFISFSESLYSAHLSGEANEHLD